MAELDQHLVAAQLLLRPLEVLERVWAEDDVRRKLEEDPAELAGRTERFERFAEASEDLRAKLPRGPLEPSPVVHRRSLAQVRRQLLELHGMARHRPEGLDVHDEAVRRPLRPPGDHLLDRQPVIGRVDLDGVEVLGVVRQPVARLRPGRIEVLREGFVGPGARSDANLGHRHRSLPDRRTAGPRALSWRGPATLTRRTTAERGW